MPPQETAPHSAGLSTANFAPFLVLLFLRFLDVGRLLALGALRHIEGDLLAFLEGLEALHLDRGEMREEVFAAVVGCNEPVPLRVIEPLHSSGCHSIAYLLLNGWSPAHRSAQAPHVVTK